MQASFTQVYQFRVCEDQWQSEPAVILLENLVWYDHQL